MPHLRHAFRQLAKAPAFTFAAVFTLALGIGSATTVFTAFNGLLLRPMPLIQNQERMLLLEEALPAKNVEHMGIALADFLDWRARTTTLEALWLSEERTAIVTGRSAPVRKNAAGISANAFPAMGVRPMLGRDFRPEEDIPGAPPVAILAHHTWKRDYGGADDIVGQSIKLNGVETQIIGVMPKGWRYPERADLWLPMQANPADAMRGHFRPMYRSHAMLKPGATLDEARTDLAAISSALAKEYPLTNDGVAAVLQPVRHEASGDTTQLTLLLLGAVTFVFLIACGNVANLLLARASARSKEIALRLALGARRRQLIAQLLAESLLLALLGGTGGLIFALWGIDFTVSLIPEEHHPFWLNFGFDWRVFAFTGGLSALASVIFGLVPAWQATRPELIDEIKEGSRGGGSGARSHELRSALVIVEIALALVLLVGAGLMMRSFVQLHHTSPGFDPHGVLTFRVGFPTTVTDDKDVLRRFFQDLMPRLATLPGASSAGATSVLPGIGGGGLLPVQFEGRPLPKSTADIEAAIGRWVTPEYFATLRIPLKAGRYFDSQDDAEHPRVAIVDELFVKKYFPNQSPLGQRICTLSKAEKFEWLEIVGVVGVARRLFDRDDTYGTCYVPHAQAPAAFMSVVLRVEGEPASYLPAVRAAVLAVNKDMPIYYEMSLMQAIERSDAVWIRKFFSGLFAAFAIVALLLASIGIYGVMAYAVAQRTQEIGMRMALGAQPRDVVRMVVRRGLGLIGFGLAAGMVAALFTTGLLSENLYHTSPWDPATFAIVPLILATVALVACWLPTWRATSIDPNSALRAE